MSSDDGTNVLTLMVYDLHVDPIGHVNGDGSLHTCLDDCRATQREDAPDAAVLSRLRSSRVGRRVIT